MQWLYLTKDFCISLPFPSVSLPFLFSPLHLILLSFNRKPECVSESAHTHTHPHLPTSRIFTLPSRAHEKAQVKGKNRRLKLRKRAIGWEKTKDEAEELKRDSVRESMNDGGLRLLFL